MYSFFIFIFSNGAALLKILAVAFCGPPSNEEKHYPMLPPSGAVVIISGRINAFSPKLRQIKRNALRCIGIDGCGFFAF